MNWLDKLPRNSAIASSSESMSGRSEEHFAESIHSSMSIEMSRTRTPPQVGSPQLPSPLHMTSLLRARCGDAIARATLSLSRAGFSEMCGGQRISCHRAGRDAASRHARETCMHIRSCREARVFSHSSLLHGRGTARQFLPPITLRALREPAGCLRPRQPGQAQAPARQAPTRTCSRTFRAPSPTETRFSPRPPTEARSHPPPPLPGFQWYQYRRYPLQSTQ